MVIKAAPIAEPKPPSLLSELQVILGVGGRAEVIAAVVKLVEASRPKPGARRLGRPRIGREAETLKSSQPWLEEDPPLSRSTWYRRRKEGLGDE